MSFGRFLTWVALAASLLALVGIPLLYLKITQEQAERRTQACRGLELQHKQEITDLERSYRFYTNPPPEFSALLDNPLVREQLRDRERAARNDRDRYGVFVPPYCDEPSTGLKEPDPAVPERPARLNP